MTQHNKTMCHRERIIEFKRESMQDEIKQKNDTLIKRLSTCKPNLTSLIESDKVYAPADKPMPYFPRRKSAGHKPIDTPLSHFAKRSYLDSSGLLKFKKSDLNESATLNRNQKHRNCAVKTDSLYNPFKNSEQKIKDQDKRYSFFLQKRRNKDTQPKPNIIRDRGSTIAAGTVNDNGAAISYRIECPMNGSI